jgi:hypothetical protein
VTSPSSIGGLEGNSFPEDKEVLARDVPTSESRFLWLYVAKAETIPEAALKSMAASAASQERDRALGILVEAHIPWASTTS